MPKFLTIATLHNNFDIRAQILPPDVAQDAVPKQSWLLQLRRKPAFTGLADSAIGIKDAGDLRQFPNRSQSFSQFEPESR